MLNTGEHSGTARQLFVLCQAVAVASLAALGGCTAVQAPDVEATSVSYRLESIDSEPVPTLSVASGSIQLNFDGTFVERIRYASSGLSGNFTYTGFFAKSGASVELTYANQRPYVFDTVAVVDDALVRRDCDALLARCRPDLVYRRER